jgi:hypothetical protein
MSAKFEPDFAEAKDAAERLVKLFAEPEPGLGTWHLCVGSALSRLDTALFSQETLRLELAAPELLLACQAIVSRVRGEFDDHALCHFGPLEPDTAADCRRIAEAGLAKMKGGQP